MKTIGEPTSRAPSEGGPHFPFPVCDRPLFSVLTSSCTRVMLYHATRAVFAHMCVFVRVFVVVTSHKAGGGWGPGAALPAMRRRAEGQTRGR